VNLASFAELAVRLVNSAVSGANADPLRGRDAFREFVADQPALAGVVLQHDLDRLKLLRGDLAAIFALCSARQDADAVSRLNDLMMIHPVLPVLTAHDGEDWHLHLSWSGSAADRFAAAAIFGLISLISRQGTGRLGYCPVAGCGRVFADACDDRSGIYCTEHRVQEVINSLRPQRQRSDANPQVARANQPR
jgi:predicted RNA-binding Zn ribbon-like protein